MKLSNIQTAEGVHLALVTERGIVDATAAGCTLSMDELIAGADRSALERLAADESLPTVEAPVYANVVNRVGKLICVGLNYREHAVRTHMAIPKAPVLFSKFADALSPSGSVTYLPGWEDSYDYEAELVIVIGKEAWGLSGRQAAESIFGYTCGNDFSCRDAQMRSGQWLIGKAMPGFGPCGPCIVTADSFDPEKPHAIRSYVNGELRQNSCVTDMIFSCAEIVSYASHYIHLHPGDLIYTGTPCGVALEGGKSKFGWLRPGDVVDVEIEGIGTLHNTLA